jgi:hypothetical protein
MLITQFTKIRPSDSFRGAGSQIIHFNVLQVVVQLFSVASNSARNFLFSVASNSARNFLFFLGYSQQQPTDIRKTPGPNKLDIKFLPNTIDYDNILIYIYSIKIQ